MATLSRTLLACLQTWPEGCRSPVPTPDVSHWWAHWPGRQGVPAHGLDLAITSGFAADRLAWAFAGGYQAALRALVPGLPADEMAAFCVTETGGNRPRDITTTITPQADGSLRVDGAKRWATLGPAGSRLLVVGRWLSPAVAPAGAATDSAAVAAGARVAGGPGVAVFANPVPRPCLRVLQVPVPSPGLQVLTMPATRFVPEVPHAQLQLQGVLLPASALLPGDGYDAYVKPFRTLEDVHVTAAVLALLLREARVRQWPPAFAEQLVATLLVLSQVAEGVAALRADSGTPPVNAPGRAEVHQADEAALHVALAGALHVVQGLLADAAPLWAAAGDDPATQRWQRDVALLGVAGTARQLRAERAWSRLQVPAADEPRAPGGQTA